MVPDGKGGGETFVRNLLREACCPTLMGTIKDCSWDKEKQSITTAAQAEEEARLKELENAAWYKDEFGPSLMTKVKKLKSYSDAEALYALDGERLVKTLHASNDPKPSAQKKRKGGDIEPDKTADSDLSMLSTSISGDDDDTSMDSASMEKNDTPNGAVEVGQGNTSRVRFTRRTAASSADDSASLPSAGGG
jgi:hypothetical protein